MIYKWTIENQKAVSFLFQFKYIYSKWKKTTVTLSGLTIFNIILVVTHQ